MDYQSSDFSRCLFDPTKKGLLKAYQRLNNIGIIDEKLLKYIICAYDFNSPFVKEYKDLKLRKQSAAQFAGFSLENDDLEYLFDFKNEDIVNAIDVYLKEFMCTMLWYGIVANEQVYYEYGKRMMQPIEDKDTKEKDVMSAISIKSKLSEDMANIRGRIEADYKKLYGDDELEKVITQKKFRPENYSQKV